MLKQEFIELAKYRLELAKEALQNAEGALDRSEHRNSNNRAYYAIFYAMRAVIALDGADYKRHSGVIQHFQRDYIKTGIFPKEFSKIITEVSEVRNMSDYNDFYIASKDQTRKHLNLIFEQEMI